MKRYVMRAYGRTAPRALRRNVSEITLRADAAEAAVQEAHRRWDEQRLKRRWRGFAVFDHHGKPLVYVDGSSAG